MMNRREALGSLSAFTLLGSLMDAQADGPSSPTDFKIFRFSDMPVTHNASGAAGRNVPRDLMVQGDLAEVRITTVDPGKDFSPMGKNPNHVFRMIHTGKMELLTESKPPLTAEVGDIVYAPANQPYQVRSTGDAPLTYFLFEIKPKPAGA
jgi:mannose-6-phosphate isomerase-like protein (cupin superfamily)